ncbi:hypothetical protein QBC39DRAFT_368204 [Podospora conica]|nr:hypothetical protein QBC39DRAFT_368204 [Schizothecium conicum]
MTDRWTSRGHPKAEPRQFSTGRARPRLSFVLHTVVSIAPDDGSTTDPCARQNLLSSIAAAALVVVVVVGGASITAATPVPGKAAAAAPALDARKQSPKSGAGTLGSSTLGAGTLGSGALSLALAAGDAWQEPTDQAFHLPWMWHLL